MSEKEVREILEQVWKRYYMAWKLFSEKKYDKADKQISELRDVLDDIYDRPDEKLIEPGYGDYR